MQTLLKNYTIYNNLSSIQIVFIELAALQIFCNEHFYDTKVVHLITMT